MGLNGFSQDPVQAPMSLVSCCSGFEWLSPLGLGSGMRCEETHWNRTAPPSHRHLGAPALPQERTQKVFEVKTRSSVYVQRLTIKMLTWLAKVFGVVTSVKPSVRAERHSLGVSLM